jgi:hypothetical protein
MNVGIWLWRLFYGELTGLRTSLWLSEQPIFTDSERLALKAVARDEARHTEIVLKAARQYLQVPAQAPVVTKIETDPVAALRQLSHGEGLFVRRYHTWLRPHLTAELQHDFDTVLADERRHRSLGKNILFRLKAPYKKAFTDKSPWRQPA